MAEFESKEVGEQPKIQATPEQNQSSFTTRRGTDNMSFVVERNDAEFEPSESGAFALPRLRRLDSDEAHRVALNSIRLLMKHDPDPGTPEFDYLQVQVVLVEQYEQEQYPIDVPDPIAFLEYRLDQMGLDTSALAPYLGGRGRISEVLNRKRPLSLGMIRKLSEGMDIPLGILASPYRTSGYRTRTPKKSLKL